jgi:hypothetical protein
MGYHEATPAHLPPPPRTVHGGFSLGLWFIRLFILPHMCVGAGLIGAVGLTCMTALFGADLEARVVKAYTSHSSKHGTVYHLDYRYHGASREYTNSDTVTANAYAVVNRPGEAEGRAVTVRVRYLELGPVHYHLLLQECSPWKSAGGLLLFAGFWNGVLSVFVHLAWVAPIRNRLLVRHGLATPGTLLSTRESPGKSTTYYAKFRFVDPGTGQEIEREMTLPGRAQYTAARPKQPVTVLYDPRRPKRALVYELSGYRVDGAN